MDDHRYDDRRFAVVHVSVHISPGSEGIVSS